MALSRITEAVASFTDLTIGDDLTLTDDFLMASDASIIKFGADADVTLTHVHNTGLLLNSTSVIQFNDASQNIGAPSATVLDINATDEIELNATLVDVNANLDVSGTYTGAGLMTTGGNIVIPDAGTIGSASDTDAIAIASDGKVTFTQDIILKDGVNIGSASDTNAIGISSGGVVSITSTTANTSTSDGALTVAGGLGVAADASVGDDLRLISDAAVLSFGTNSEVTLTHVHDTGLLLNSTMALQFNDASQFINAPSATVLDINATDEIELNATLVDINANLDVSGTYTGGGLMTTGGNIVIPDAGNIGSASDTDAIAIASNGQVTFSQTLIGTALDISGDIDVDGTTNLDVVDIDGAVDMASTLQVDGAITSSAGATITTADNSDTLTLKSTDADASTGANLVLQRDSASPADNDLTGTIKFKADNDAGEVTDLVSIFSKIIDASDGTEDASLLVNSIVGGSQVSRLNITPTEIAINDDSISSDFRVEGATDANNLIVDASGDRVGIGVAAPASKLEISAGGNSHGLLRLDETDASNLAGYMQFDSNGTNKANIQNANNAGIHINVGTGGSVTFTALGYTAANALDDYEEGTWTPAFTSTSASFSYATQGGTYTKVGRLIMASFRLALSGSPSGTTSNSVVVSGLPFNTGTLNQTYHGGAFGHYFAFNLSQTGVLVYQLATGATTVELKVVGDNLSETGVLASHLNSNAEIRGQIVYHTA